MPLVGDISGSASRASRIGVTGSVVFAGADPDHESAFPSMGSDVAFYVSGNIGGKDSTTEQGVSVFGGDTVVSGTLDIGSSAASTPTTTALDVYANVSSDYAVKIDNDQSSAGHGLKVTTDGNSSDTYAFDIEFGSTTFFRVRADGRVGIGKVTSLPQARLTIDGSSLGGDNADISIAGKIQHIGDSNTHLTFPDDDQIQLTAGAVNFIHITEDDTQDKIVFNEDGADVDFRVESDTKENALLIVGSTDQVLILSGGAAASTNEAAGGDVTFYVSGGFGNQGYSGGDVSVFGGDVVLSGALFAGQSLAHANPYWPFSADYSALPIFASRVGIFEPSITLSSPYSWGTFGGSRDKAMLQTMGAHGYVDGWGLDGNFYVTGSSGAKSAGAFGGVSIFAGDLVCSGTIYNAAGSSYSTGGGGSPAGSDSQIQYNNGGSFGGASKLTYDDNSGEETLTLTGTMYLSGNSYTQGPDRLLIDYHDGGMSVSNGQYGNSTITPSIGVYGDDGSNTHHILLTYGSGSNSSGSPGNNDMKAQLAFARHLPNDAAVAQGSGYTDGSELGSITSYGHDGTRFVRGAEISFVVSGTVTTSKMPTKITFGTNAGTDANNPWMTGRMAIHPNGSVSIGTTSQSRDQKNYSLWVNGAAGFDENLKIMDHMILSGNNSKQVGIIQPTYSGITFQNYGGSRDLVTIAGAMPSHAAGSTFWVSGALGGKKYDKNYHATFGGDVFASGTVFHQPATAGDSASGGSKVSVLGLETYFMSAPMGNTLTVKLPHLEDVISNQSTQQGYGPVTIFQYGTGTTTLSGSDSIYNGSANSTLSMDAGGDVMTVFGMYTGSGYMWIVINEITR